MRTVAWIVLALMACTGIGCQRSLFNPKLPRHQFETYDTLRYNYVPLEQPDVFGNPQPALRERLSQSQWF